MATPALSIIEAQLPRTVLDLIPAAVFVAAVPTGDVISANASAERLCEGAALRSLKTALHATPHEPHAGDGDSITRAITEGETQSPSVLAAMYGVDVAELAVKISEGALYPNLGLTASATKSWDPLFNINKETAISVLGTLTVPIYQGGTEYSAIRQSKETLGQQRLNLDVNRDQARATVVQSWGQLDAAKAQIESTTAQVNAAEIALNGVREEARVGQRTTFDVLTAQQAIGLSVHLPAQNVTDVITVGQAFRVGAHEGLTQEIEADQEREAEQEQGEHAGTDPYRLPIWWVNCRTSPDLPRL